MVKKNIKKIIIAIIAISMVLIVANVTFASSGSVEDELQGLTSNKQPSNLQNQEPNQIPEGNKAPTPAANNLLDDNNVGKNTNDEPTTTPDTGIGDYSSAIFIVIFAISAVYAYKKIRDYNV